MLIGSGGGGRGAGHGRDGVPWATRARLDHRRVCASSCSIAGEIYIFAEVLEDNFLGLRDDDIALRQCKFRRVVGRRGASHAICTGQGSTVGGASYARYSVKIDATGTSTCVLQRESLARAARRNCALGGGHLHSKVFAIVLSNLKMLQAQNKKI